MHEGWEGVGMAKNRTMQAQFYYALQSINLSNDLELRKEIFFKSTGVEKYQPTKRDFKKYGIASGYVFSFCSMQSVLSISKDFAKYCRENNITKATKITPATAVGFLEKKATEGASVRTLLAYKSALIKIDNAIKNAFNCKGFCRTENNVKNFVIGKPEPIERRLTNNQVEQILQQKTKYSLCMSFQCDFGLRVNELKNISISDFHFEGGKFVKMIKQGTVNTSNTLYVHCGTKGGLDRFVRIPTEKIEQYKNFVSYCKENNIEKPFKKLDRHNYNRAIKTISNKLGFGSIGSSHEFRKYYASMRYQNSVLPGMTKTEKLKIALRIIKDLGHGRCRQDLIKTYIGNL